MIKKQIMHIIKELIGKEESQDKLISLTRIAVRLCATSIKNIHARELKEAEYNLREAGQMVKKIKKICGAFSAAEVVFQEYGEAKVLLELINRKPIPSDKSLGIPPEIYLNSLLDLIGELRREMLENLRKGRHEDAEYYFECMEKIYEELLPIKFANSILPNFRRKQDAARHSLEQARSELFFAKYQAPT